MLGKPKFKMGSQVDFVTDGTVKSGNIEVIDAYGTYFDKTDVMYDIFVEPENCLYKHIHETNVVEHKANYVIRFNTGVYWCGYNAVSPQLRKAKVYTSVKQAHKVAEDVLLHYDRVSIKDTKKVVKATSYKIYEVALQIIQEIK